MSTPAPEPRDTAGLEPGGGVQPGDTPPASDSMSGATGGEREHTPNMGPNIGNRTPMFIALFFIGLLVVGAIGYGVAQIYTYATEDADEEQGGLPAVTTTSIRGD